MHRFRLTQSMSRRSIRRSSRLSKPHGQGDHSCPRKTEQWFGALLLFVLTATDHGRPELERLEQELQDELTQLSTNSIQRLVDGATHSSLIIEQQDAQVTVDAVQQVIEAVRTGKPLAS